MSKALRCDRCKKCFVPEESEGTMVKFRNPVRYTAEDLTAKATANTIVTSVTCSYVTQAPPDEMVDLCPACSLLFLRFMKQNSQK